MGAPRLLRFGDWSIGADAGLLSQGGPRCTLGPFLTTEGTARLELRAQALSPGLGAPLDPRRPEGARFLVDGDVVRVEPTSQPLDVELALRVVLQLATLRQGGVLLHAAGVALGERGVVVVGPSGAGKSTFTRLCQRAVGADVLSDEVIALYPDGTVEGSPFCSDLDLPSSRARARLAALFLLRQGPEERLDTVDPREAVAALLGQVFRPLPGEAAPGEVLGRLARLVEATPVRRFTFRKDDAAARFVREWVHGWHAPR